MFILNWAKFERELLTFVHTISEQLARELQKPGSLRSLFLVNSTAGMGLEGHTYSWAIFLGQLASGGQSRVKSQWMWILLLFGRLVSTQALCPRASQPKSINGDQGLFPARQKQPGRVQSSTSEVYGPGAALMGWRAASDLQWPSFAMLYNTMQEVLPPLCTPPHPIPAWLAGWGRETHRQDDITLHHVMS